MFPACGRMPASRSASAPDSWSTAVECATKSPAGTGQRMARRAARAAPNSASASGCPETTVVAGPLTAATASRSPQGSISSRTAATGITTDSIPPLVPRADSSWLRTATTAAASVRERMPATVAAAISPWEWPTTAAGVTPAASHTAARATITAHSSGCATSARSSPGAPSAPASTSAGDQCTCGASASAHWEKRSANTGEAARSSRPMPAHWAPCPGKTKTGPASSAPSAAAVVPAITWGLLSPVASASSPAVSSVRSAPLTTARYSCTVRVVASDQAMSAACASGWAARCSASWAAWRRSPSAVRPDTSQATGPGAASSAGGVGD